jgi:hypothetical protein
VRKGQEKAKGKENGTEKAGKGEELHYVIVMKRSDPGYIFKVYLEESNGF